MTDPRPEPLTSILIDLTGFPSFQMNVERLFQSELWQMSTGEEFKAAVALWGRAWQQRPAGSLPNDERILAGFSGTGKRWPKVKDVALRGFVECSDGRLYHRFLCDDVIRAWGTRVAYRKQTEAATRARNERRNGQRNVDRNEVRNVPRNEDEGEGEVEGEIEKRERESAHDPPAPDLIPMSLEQQTHAEMTALGAEMTGPAGEDLWPQWKAVCRGYHPKWIEKLLRIRPTPRWPSKMEKRLAECASDYPGWKEEFNMKKETA